MRPHRLLRLVPGALLLALAACGDRSSIPYKADMGLTPVLEKPVNTLIPTVEIAPATGWPPGATPTPAAGLAVNAFATGLDHPRWLYVLPNGDVLVAESNAPPRSGPEGIKGFLMSIVKKKMGAAVPSANRISLLRDADGDGVAELRTVFLENLNSPFGMALVGEMLYVANTDGIVRFPYRTGDTRIAARPELVAPLPAGPINYHWTRNILPSRDGGKLFATVGSNSNVAEYGLEQENNRAAILEVDIGTGQTRLYAAGLRNPNGMGFHPQTGQLWTVVNERDEIGSDLVPDYLSTVREGGFYGWPYSYYGQHVDERVEPQRPELVARAIVPDYALGSHVAALGLAFYQGSLFPPQYVNGAFIGQHGSWNRKPKAGYNVVFVPFVDGRPVGKPIEVLGGFINDDDEAMGRPVGVVVDKAGAVLIADDVGNVVWRLRPAGTLPAASPPVPVAVRMQDGG